MIKFIGLEIKDTTDTERSASYIDLHLEIDSEGRLRTKHYDKRDDFNFPMLNFPFIWSNIPAASAYGVYISRLIRYSRADGSYQDFLDRGLLLTRKLLIQGFLLVKLKSSLQKFYRRHHDWLTVVEYLCHKWSRICSICRKQFPVLSSIMTGFVTRLTRQVSLMQEELLTLPEHLSSPPGFSGVRVTRSIVLCVCFVDRCLSFCTFFWAFVLSVLLWYTESDYPFGIFKLFL